MDGDRAVAQQLTIVNRKGLHARASARFVRTAECFDASLHVIKDGQSVNGNSIMGLMMLGAGPGSNHSGARPPANRRARRWKPLSSW